MCVVSVVMDMGSTAPRPLWQQPDFVPFYNDLLWRAHQYDVANNEPDCELDEKRKALKRIAEKMGVSIKFTFDKPPVASVTSTVSAPMGQTFYTDGNAPEPPK